MVEEVARGVALVRDTSNVYVLRNGREGIVIDFGSGAVLDRLEELGLDRITDVLVTHHHRDQVQGLVRAVEHGAAAEVDEDGVAARGEDVDVAGVAEPRDARADLLEGGLPLHV